MIDYMAERTELHIDPSVTVEFTVKGKLRLYDRLANFIIGRDLHALLFNFLDEILCLFVTEPHLHVSRLTITSFSEKEIHVTWYVHRTPCNILTYP
jgi:hypothetical protein